MTLTTLIIGVGIAALLLTGLVAVFNKGHKNWIMTYLQNFTGALFIFSGYVKAIDPLGTAYKMEQYFTEFESTFQDTWFSFIAPLFPFLSDLSIGFSVFMIVFEIVLGIMLIIGHRPKLTSWAFLLLVAFFTFLTGFTYLTGYVPEGVNFFSFSSWDSYKATNMKVTDCGCFGDFLVLEPKVSFLKDVFLLIPAIYFVIRHRDMHQWFSSKIRWVIIGLSSLVFLIYCFSNFYWDIPGTDFRPFNKGKDVRTTKMVEEDAQANVQIVAYQLKSKEDGSILELPYAEYLKKFKELKLTHDVVDQIKTEPSIKKTKISDFEITDIDGNDVTYEVIDREGMHLMVVSYKMYGDAIKKNRTVTDTTYIIDSLDVEGEIEIVKKVDKLTEREESYFDYVWEDDFLENYKDLIAPMAAAAKADNVGMYSVVGGAGEEMINDFKAEAGLQDFKFYTADDILLKTIVRSNPGVVLWKDGVIVDKWHYKHLPSYDEIMKMHR